MRISGFLAPVLALVLLGAPAATPAPQPQLRSSADERESVAITVYNQNFGLVREVRAIELVRGPLALAFGDVARTIQPETVHIRPLAAGADVRVLEQNYQYDLLNPQKLLEKYVGRRVKVFRWNEKLGRDEEHDAEVLAAGAAPILKIGDEISFSFPGRIAFPEIPENLIARPTLSWLLESRGGRQPLEVSYLASGLNWRADYVLVLNDAETQGGLTGWVTLSNESGAAYENAQLKLVAGDVQRVSPEVLARPRAMREDMMMAAQAPAFQEEEFFEYHLYTLGRPTTLRDNEQKQVTLLEAQGVPLQKRLILQGQLHYFRGQFGQVETARKVGVYLDLVNSEANQLGMPLPRGIVRVYKADRTGALQFVGEDRIDHTPRDEEVRIKTGEAFDVVADRRQLEYRVLGNCRAESAWQIELRNRKDSDVEVDVIEPAGGDWRILSSSDPHERLDVNRFRFRVQVASRSEKQLEYRIRVRWC